MTATRRMRRGSRNNDQKPNRHRSSAYRLGARRRERLMTRSCCAVGDHCLRATRSEELGDRYQKMEEEYQQILHAVQGRGRCNQGQDYPNHRLRGEYCKFASDSMPVCAFYVSGTPGASFPSILLRTSCARNSAKGPIFWSILADSSAAI